MTSFKLLPSAAVLCVAALAGCSSSGSTMPGMSSSPSGTASPATPGGAGTPAAGAHNEADVTFASGMVPHHQQAVQMSDMLLGKRGINPSVIDLAGQIKAAQTPEITQMSGWLAGWGENPSPSSMGGMAGMDHGDGLMSQADMDALDQASGRNAEKLFLTGMVRHHRGAVTMAQAELTQGQNPDAKQLARTIVMAQKAEITQMDQLLGR